jgi:hypothetical protein
MCAPASACQPSLPRDAAYELTPEQAFFKATQIDPDTPHPYFIGRALDSTRFPDLDKVVRLARYRRTETDAWGPALIWAVTDNEGNIVGRQYTPLTPDQSVKDGLDPARKNGKGDKIKGCAIRLGHPRETIYVCESPEDAMTVMLAFDMQITVFAMGGAGMMDGFIPPKGTRGIVILADHDATGIQGATKAVPWFATLGLTVGVAEPPPDGGKDFNDAIKGKSGEALDQAYGAVRAAVEAAEVRFVSPFSGGECAEIQTFDDCLKTAAVLESGDHARVLALLARAAAIGLSGVQTDILVNAVRKATGIGLKTLRNTLADETKEARLKAYEAGAAERERLAGAQEAERRQKIEEKRARLWNSCSKIAESKTLLADMEEVAHALGVVGEGASVRQLYLTYASRLLGDDSVRLLRLGAPAAGKNVVVEKTLELIPSESVIRFSSASPKALAYYRGTDPDAFKGKIVYIPEAVFFTDRYGVESEFTVMLRTLISEGRVVYSFVSVREGHDPVTVEIVKNGPIAAVITTARDVDPELKTRTLVNDADETGGQTVAILKRILSDVKAPRPDLQPWLDFQAWLMRMCPIASAFRSRRPCSASWSGGAPIFLKPPR